MKLHESATEEPMQFSHVGINSKSVLEVMGLPMSGLMSGYYFSNAIRRAP